jgi:hypothetical protein
MDVLMIIGLAVVGIIVIVAAVGTLMGALFCGDIMSYTDTSSQTLDPVIGAPPKGKVLVVYNPGVSGAAKSAAGDIASDIRAKGYTVTLAGIKSAVAANTSGYDVIIAGGPMYFGRVSNSVDTYLKTLKPQQGVSIGVFGTTGSPEFHNEDIATLGEQVSSDLGNMSASTKTIRSGNSTGTDCADFVAAVV